MNSRMIETSHGAVAVAETDSDGPTVLLVHGNSSCKEVFRSQFESELASRYHLVAPDLPGHGGSENARDPLRSYSLVGYAEMLVELLGVLGVTRTAVLGWSLGGHVGLELVRHFPGVTRLMIVGTPPVRLSPEGIAAGFVPRAGLELIGKEAITDAEAVAWASDICGSRLPLDPHLVAMCKRTDGRARRMMLESVLSGRGHDEVEIVATAPMPLAILNGAEDLFVDTHYLCALAYANLWDGMVLLMPGVGHAPFLQAPRQFNAAFERFLQAA